MTLELRRQLRPAIGALLALTLITGFAYPLAVTAVAAVVFPTQANGSLVVVDGLAVGSVLIGQAFDDPAYLWGRISAAGEGYDANASGGANLAPTSRALIERVASDVERYQAAGRGSTIPVDLVTASASGLDPHISPAGADYQAERIAAARGVPLDEVRAAIARHTEGPTLGFLGAARVNVLLVNLDLDGLLR